MTYYDYFEFSFKILHLFQDLIRLERISSKGDKLFKAESNPKYKGNMESILTSLYETFMHKQLNSVTVPYISVSHVYSLNKSQQDSTSFLCPLLFASLGLDVFFEVLCNIYLENSIIFVSNNLNVLTSSM